mmetsp:Transcript_38624/g.97252  ORF Transcript_38624/g.97252 Transcript_38624/m.97252 type:complete len:276 (-) Transcript_38624:155-982(-)
MKAEAPVLGTDQFLQNALALLTERVALLKFGTIGIERGTTRLLSARTASNGQMGRRLVVTQERCQQSSLVRAECTEAPARQIAIRTGTVALRNRRRQRVGAREGLRVGTATESTAVQVCRSVLMRSNRRAQRCSVERRIVHGRNGAVVVAGSRVETVVLPTLYTGEAGALCVHQTPRLLLPGVTEKANGFYGLFSGFMQTGPRLSGLSPEQAVDDEDEGKNAEQAEEERYDESRRGLIGELSRRADLPLYIRQTHDGRNVEETQPLHGSCAYVGK